MKKLTLSLSIALLGLAGFASTSAAQWNEGRGGTRVYAERGGRGDSRDDHVGYDIERLNREVRAVREQIRAAGGGGRRIRADFHQVLRASERLNEQYRRGDRRAWELRRRADEIRVELNRIQRELRFRGPRAWR